MNLTMNMVKTVVILFVLYVFFVPGTRMFRAKAMVDD